MKRVNRAGLALGTAAALMLGGCGKKVGGQVVAVVNGEEITQQQLNAELNGQQVPPGANGKAVTAQLLQRVIDRKLLVGRAKDQGLTKSPTYLAQVQRAQDAVLIEMLASNAAKSVPLPDATAAGQFITQNPSLFAGRKRYQLDQLAFRSGSDPALEAKLRPTKTMAEVEAVLKDAGIAFQRGTGQLDTAALPPAIAARIGSLPSGQPFIVPQNGQLIVNVIRSTEPVPVDPQQAQPAAIELLRRQSVEQAMRKQVQQARGAAQITYAPGFAPPKAGSAPPAS
ncbi:peptidyl-prolyl cis-trans isomerase [Sphingomonas bacterium]|uniref:peptidyl-prolyl cis-trans isomerase n=1 Tax=Sphingomonas bacterium TaxID=1895847 RepID=UPI0015775541|nr:peptidyl-prolyl cis-trans isomerase [Sphingomonas bacterium]